MFYCVDFSFWIMVLRLYFYLFWIIMGFRREFLGFYEVIFFIFEYFFVVVVGKINEIINLDSFVYLIVICKWELGGFG